MIFWFFATIIYDKTRVMRKFLKDSVPQPIDIQKLIEKLEELTLHPYQKLVVEIGCGVGLHPLQYALNHPDHFMIAFEHTREKFEKFERRIQNHKHLPNLMAIHGNAISWICHGIKNASLDAVYLLYPNPNPKPSDLNKRWHAMPFMSEILRVLKDQGELIIATNEKVYALEALEWMTNEWKCQLIEQRELSMDLTPEWKARTHFEKKYLARGETCFNLRFRKTP